MNGATKLVVAGAVVGVAVATAYAYVQRRNFAEATASGDFDAAELAANAALLHGAWMKQVAVPAALFVLALLLLTTEGNEAPLAAASLPPPFPGYL